jgi:2'-5' RNA ligase
MSVQAPLHSAFIALPLEAGAKRRFHDLLEAFWPWEEILRFQNPRTPHLTLYFWRELMQIEYDQVLRVAGTIAKRTAPFTLETTGVGTLGTKEGDRVLVLTLQFSPELAAVKKLCPWPNPPEKPFHPHVTIARISHPQRFIVVKKKVLRALGEAVFPIPFDRLRLFAEIEGRKQTPLEDFSFAGV